MSEAWQMQTWESLWPLAAPGAAASLSPSPPAPSPALVLDAWLGAGAGLVLAVLLLAFLGLRRLHRRRAPARALRAESRRLKAALSQYRDCPPASRAERAACTRLLEGLLSPTGPWTESRRQAYERWVYGPENPEFTLGHARTLHEDIERGLAALAGRGTPHV